jgi:hypothetical protein
MQRNYLIKQIFLLERQVHTRSGLGQTRPSSDICHMTAVSPYADLHTSSARVSNVPNSDMAGAKVFA